MGILMTLLELDEMNKALIIENNNIRRIIDEIDLLHYRSLNEDDATKRHENLLKENTNLKNKLSDYYS